jgi:fructose-1,6-bisphosphatase II
VAATEARCICGHFAFVTEDASLAAAAWLGRGDGLAADVAAREAMAVGLAQVPVRGRVVAGRCGTCDCATLCVGEETGSRDGPWLGTNGQARGCEGDPETWDIVVDPLQALKSLAAGTDGALAVLAAGPAGSLMHVPEMYMQKLIVPSSAAGVMDLDAPVAKNIRAVAAALGRRPDDLVVVVLDRPRHEVLINEVREAGARVRLIPDGDVSAGIAVAAGDPGVDMYVGIGGSTEGILTAAALRCMGGEILARFWPVSRHQVASLTEAGIEDVEKVFSTRDMAGDGVLFCATAVTGGRFLKGVQIRPEGIRTETLLLCSSCHAVRKIATTHRTANDGPQVSLAAR